MKNITSNMTRRIFLKSTAVIGAAQIVNPFRKVWVFSIKRGHRPRGRNRYYFENKNLIKGTDWSDSVYWTNADHLDHPEPDGRYPGAGEPTQLYSLNAVAYKLRI